MNKDDLNTIQHFAEDSTKYYGAITPPIMQTSLFKFESLKDFWNGLENEQNVHAYTRGNNPTCEILEKKIAKLECGERAKCFGSGQGALAAIFLSLVSAGEEILIVNNVYGPTTQLLKELERFNVKLKIAYVEKAEDIEAHIQDNTRIIYYESPSTHLMKVLDVRKIVALAKPRNILTVTDNTWSTPLYHKPLELGVDISMHSLTKYISGHSDVVGGIVISSEEIMKEIFRFGHQFLGAVLAPFDAWLALRGLRTLEARLTYQQVTTKKVIDYLKTNKKVKMVNHPLCLEGSELKIFEEIYSGYTSLLSFELVTEEYSEIEKFVDELKIFSKGVSWGGFESLIFPSYNGKNESDLEMYKKPKGLVRLYLGLESAEELIEDLDNAFNK